jgi:plasmid maintenance system antidote protein VapI
MHNPSSKSHVQEVFFERLKEKCSPSLSFVDEVAEVLGASNDSAYRRLRNETAITLDEALTLANHFGIGIDEFTSPKSDMVMFGRSTFREKPEDFFTYLEKTAERFGAIAAMKEKKGIYAAKDIPTFCYFQVPEFAEFKLYYWLRTIRGNALIQDEKFNFGLVPDDLIKKSRAIAKYYFQIPFTELWSEDTVNVALRQIEYFHEAGWMPSVEVAVKVCDALEEIIRGVQ